MPRRAYKTCTKCREAKPLDAFRGESRVRDGLRSRCKACEAAALKAWRDTHREQARATDARWREKNRARLLTQKRQWKAKLRSRLAEQQREWVTANPETARATEQRYNRRYPEKRKAKARVDQAIRNGTLTRPDTCSECSAVGPVDGHHPDYSKPLEVIWLCRLCHKRRHRTAILPVP